MLPGITVQVVLHSPDSIAAVGVLHPTAFHIEPKDSSTDTVPSSQAVTEVPLDWQPQQAHPPAQPVTQSDPSSSSACVQQWQTELKLTVSQQHVHIMCSAQAPSAAAGGTGGVGGGGTAAAAAAAASFSAEDTAAALEAALLAVSSQLEALQGITSWQSSCFVHLYLADMAHFGVANAAYCRHLPQVNPPSRACVQVSGQSPCSELTSTSMQDICDACPPLHILRPLCCPTVVGGQLNSCRRVICGVLLCCCAGAPAGRLPCAAGCAVCPPAWQQCCTARRSSCTAAAGIRPACSACAEHL